MQHVHSVIKFPNFFCLPQEYLLKMFASLLVAGQKGERGSCFWLLLPFVLSGYASAPGFRVS